MPAFRRHSWFFLCIATLLMGGGVAPDLNLSLAALLARGDHEVRACGCAMENCNCGAPCCASTPEPEPSCCSQAEEPREASCCSGAGTETAGLESHVAPPGALVLTTACTCGGGKADRGVIGSTETLLSLSPRQPQPLVRGISYPGWTPDLVQGCVLQPDKVPIAPLSA